MFQSSTVQITLDTLCLIASIDGWVIARGVPSARWRWNGNLSMRFRPLLERENLDQRDGGCGDWYEVRQGDEYAI